MKRARFEEYTESEGLVKHVSSHSLIGFCLQYTVSTTGHSKTYAKTQEHIILCQFVDLGLHVYI